MPKKKAYLKANAFYYQTYFPSSSYVAKQKLQSNSFYFLMNLIILVLQDC